MSKEIERKFLVDGDFKPFIKEGWRMVQAYLCSTPERTIRIRIKGEKAYITIKGKSSANGLSRYEWEKEIPTNEAEELLNLCEPGIIDKTRYIVEHKGHCFEVDVFHGDNDGLIMAELELSHEDEVFEKPAWLGKEVTGDARYYNSMLKENPYKNW